MINKYRDERYWIFEARCIENQYRKGNLHSIKVDKYNREFNEKHNAFIFHYHNKNFDIRNFIDKIRTDLITKQEVYIVVDRERAGKFVDIVYFDSSEDKWISLPSNDEEVFVWDILSPKQASNLYERLNAFIDGYIEGCSLSVISYNLFSAL